LVYYLGHLIEKLNILSRYSDHRDRSSDNKNIVFLCLELLVVYTLEEVKLKDLKENLLSEIQYSNWTGDQKEPMAKAA